MTNYVRMWTFMVHNKTTMNQTTENETRGSAYDGKELKLYGCTLNEEDILCTYENRKGN